MAARRRDSGLALALKMSTALHRQVVEACERWLEVDHSEHEDLIRLLQKAAAPYSVPFLREAVRLKPQLECLEYDDYGSCYKRCFWVLAAIGTAKARAVIEELARPRNTYNPGGSDVSALEGDAACLGPSHWLQTREV